MRLFVTDMDASLPTVQRWAGTQPSPVAPSGRNGEPCGRRSGRLLEDARCRPEFVFRVEPRRTAECHAEPTTGARGYPAPVSESRRFNCCVVPGSLGRPAAPTRWHAAHPELHDDPPHRCCSR